VLLPPGDKEYYMLNNPSDRFILLDAKQVRPLKINTSPRYLQSVALRHVYYQHLQSPYKLSGDDSSAHGIERSNHGLAHAARQGRNIDDVLPFMIEHVAIPELKAMYEQINSSDLKDL